MLDDPSKKDQLLEKLEDLGIPGTVIVVDPIEADLMGAFQEDALSFEEALESVFEGEGAE